jgi:uncharacterized membrane protein YfhO
MLNTKYIIYDPQRPPLENDHIRGHAWFVHDIQLVANANEEIAALKDLDLAEKAIVDQRYAEALKDADPKGAGESTIALVEYQPNRLKYKADVGNGKPLAVFSEVWYPKGWKAFIDGRETSIVRANYLLRALAIPAGEHDVEFRFEPASYEAGNTISLASSLILLLALAGAGVVQLRKRKRNEEETSGKD